MTRDRQNFHDVATMADEVARLMAARLGGARRGEHPTLKQMLRRRGGALPRRLRREARILAEAERLGGHPRIARQMNLNKLSRAHRMLCAHLQPMGQMARWRGHGINMAATVAFGLMMLAAVAIWVSLRRGLI